VATPGDVRGSRLLTYLTLANAKLDEYRFNSGHTVKRLPSRRWDGGRLHAWITGKDGNAIGGGDTRKRPREPPANNLTLANAKVDEYGFNAGYIVKRLPSE